MSDQGEASRNAQAMRVLVRVRPTVSDEIAVEVNGSEIGVSFGKWKEKCFLGKFAAVLSPDASQADVYQQVIDLVESVSSGYNVCIMAYGQTGSGKSWSMIGSEGEEGIMPRAVKSVFAKLEPEGEEEDGNAAQKEQWEVHCSFLQIYGEKLCDLLSSESAELKIRESFTPSYEGSRRRLTRELYVSGLSEYRCASWKEVMTLVDRGLRHRASRATKANEKSSRSHAVLQLVIQTRHSSSDAHEAEVAKSKLFLVDLAGSERVADLVVQSSNNNNTGFAEHVAINQSLSVLGNVVSALAEGAKKRPHVPYRDSILTRLLQEALGGNSRTALLACVSPDASRADETSRTLRFAHRASTIIGSVRANRETLLGGDVHELRKTLRKAHAEIDRLKARIAELDTDRVSDARSFLDQAKLADECCRLREANAKLTDENAALREKVACKKIKRRPKTEPPGTTAERATEQDNCSTADSEDLVANSDAAKAMHILLNDLSDLVPAVPNLVPAVALGDNDLRQRCAQAANRKAMFRILDDEQESVGAELADQCANLKRLQREREELEARLASVDAVAAATKSCGDIKQAWHSDDKHALKPSKKSSHAPAKRPTHPKPSAESKKVLGIFGDARDIGTRVEIFSYRFNRAYPGQIILYDAHRQMHCILYDTGERHWQDLACGKQIKVLCPGSGQMHESVDGISHTAQHTVPPTTPLSLSAFVSLTKKGQRPPTPAVLLGSSSPAYRVGKAPTSLSAETSNRHLTPASLSASLLPYVQSIQQRR